MYIPIKMNLMNIIARDWQATSYIYRVSNFGFIMGIATLYSKTKTMDRRSIESVISEKETIYKKTSSGIGKYLTCTTFFRLFFSFLLSLFFLLK